MNEHATWTRAALSEDEAIIWNVLKRLGAREDKRNTGRNINSNSVRAPELRGENLIACQACHNDTPDHRSATEPYGRSDQASPLAVENSRNPAAFVHY